MTSSKNLPQPPPPAVHRAGARRAAALVLMLALLVTVLLLPQAGRAQGFGSATAAPASAVVQTERVRAELLAHAPDGVAPGRTVWVGLQLAHAPHWHTYWKNPGDSGLPTQLDWTLPAGVTAGPIDWPVPQKIRVGDLVNYGYEGTVLLPVPLTIGPDFKPPLFGDLELRLQASWLVCKTECIPEDGTFVLRLPAKSSTALHGAAFDAAFAAAPVPLAADAAVSARVEDGRLQLRVAGLPAALHGRTLAVFPAAAQLVEPAAPPVQQWQGEVWSATLPLSAQRSDSPASVPFVVALDGHGYEVQARIDGGWPAPPVQAVAVPPALTQALAANREAAAALGATRVDPTLAAALLGALLGGLLLNLMPCVFPVLAVKVLGFARHAADRRAHRVSGLAYSAGVVLSFVLLGVLLLALRAAGEQLGWGFQLQSPALVAALALLFTLIGLNLAGLFEVGLLLPRALVSWEARHPVVNAFLSGVLAVAIASPCTAPFMGASLGFAVGLPGPQALAIFAAIGAGMALPYLLASFVPAFAARVLPRPGAWMQTLRRLLAFPMFATVVWLVWVLGQQSGIDGAAALLALLLLTAFALWSLAQAGRARIVLGAGSLALLGFAFVALGPNVVRQIDTASSDRPARADARWQPWQPDRVEQLVASGRPVFVDFTAAWCVTCQYNKKTTLENAEVLAALDAKNVALLRADWTRRDPAISAALQRLGRSGVPVYVFYAAGRPPVVLSEVLDAADVKRVAATL